MRRIVSRVGLLVASVVQVGCGGGGGGGGPLAFEDFQPAAVVIGQPSFTANAENQGGSTAADTLAQPAGRAAFAGGNLYVPDSVNHRILGFVGLPTSNGQEADFVIGQVDLTGSEALTTASNLNFPVDCWSEGGKLFVVDRDNNRVLIWNTLPTSNVAADVVVGQADFVTSTPGTSATTLASPRSVTTGGGRMLVADEGNRRVLIWNSIPTSNGDAADLVLGQDDLTSATLQSAAADVTSEPRGVWTDGDRVIVADRLNDRVLLWESFPTSNAEPADVVVGQPDLTSNGGSLSATGVSLPGSVFVREGQLFVADTGFCRVLVWDEVPTENGVPADRVLGQSDFLHGAANDSDQDHSQDLPSSQTLFFPGGVFVTGDRLVVTDGGNHRVLIYVGD